MTVKHWDVTKKGNGEQGTRKGGWENEKCEQNRDFEGLKLGFVPITFNLPPPPPPHKKKFQKAIINTERPKKSVLKLSYPKKFLPKFSYPNKIPNSKISNPKKSFDHSCHLKFGEPTPRVQHVQSCCSADTNLLLFCPSLCLFDY